VLLAACTQVYTMGFVSDEEHREFSINLLQTTALHHAAQSLAGKHALDSMVEQTKQLINLLDVDNDGKVSRAEVNTFAFANGLDPSSVAGEFAGIDTNGNGILEQEEVASLLGSSSEDDANSGSSRSQAMPPVKQPLLKMPSSTAFAVKDVKPQIIEQPSESEVEEYFAQVPVATVQSGQSAGSQKKKNSQSDTISARSSSSSSIQYSKATANSAEISDSSLETMLRVGMDKKQKSVGPAISATQKMAEQINSEVAAGAQSMTFQAAASTLRANATAILLHAQLEARAAAQKEATEVTMKNLKEINQLQARASKAEMRAAALRARAQLEMKEAYAAVAVASTSMSKIGDKGKSQQQTPVPAKQAAK